MFSEQKNPFAKIVSNGKKQSTKLWVNAVLKTFWVVFKKVNFEFVQ